MGPPARVQIDCKVENNPARLFGLVKGELEKYDAWQTRLAPRIVLGLWHVSTSRPP